uniref:Nif11 domain-containing protein n=1 Tax=Cyanothece sp. (strain PCC 7425 / ATCC 29141) TaxID=395961 RepID=B8HQH1_CYAP4
MAQSLEQFRLKVLQDPSLSEQLKSVSSLDEFATLAVKLGQQLGYNFTIEEVRTAIEQYGSTDNVQELNDEQLEGIAGGLEFYPATDKKCGTGQCLH